MTVASFVEFFSAVKEQFFLYFVDGGRKHGALRNNVFVLYLLKDLAIYYLVAFFFFFSIFFVNQFLLLAENVLRQRVPVWDVICLVIYGLPFVIAQSAPFATLVGFMGCLGRLMSDNEVLIMRASGLKFSFILRPVMILGLIISVISFFVNDVLLPIGSIKYNDLYRAILLSNPTVELTPNSARRLNNTTIVVGEVSDTEISDIIFFDNDSEGKVRIISGGKTSVSSARNEGVLLNLNIEDGTALIIDANKRNDVDVLVSQKMGLSIFDSAVFGGNYGTSPTEMTSLDLRKELKKIKVETSDDTYRINLYTLEYNKKFSLPFASLFFAILALPLAFMFGKHNGLFIGILLGTIICVAYWAMMILGQIFASKNGFSGFWSMWLPNVLAGAAGLSLFFVLRRQ